MVCGLEGLLSFEWFEGLLTPVRPGKKSPESSATGQKWSYSLPKGRMKSFSNIVTAKNCARGSEFRRSAQWPRTMDAGCEMSGDEQGQTSEGE